MSWRPVLAAVLLAASLAVPARAHEADPNVFTVVDAVVPPLPAVTVQVRAGVADQLLVVNPTDHPLEVLDAAGEPFLRIGPDVVQADFASADWHTSNSPLGLARTPPPGGKDDWRTVAQGESWGWFDHRLHAGRLAPPPGTRAVTRLAEWSIPLRHNGSEHVVRGHVEYRPVVGAFRTKVEHAPSGVAADALDGRVPGLYLAWSGSGTLTVRGIEGEPFARFTSTGVEVNEASPTRQDDQRLRGTTPTVPVDVARPAWRRATTAPVLTWLDRRLAYAPGVPPRDALRSRKPTTVVEWDIAADVDGAPASLRGTTTWVPNDTGTDTSRLPWLVVPAVLAGAVALVVTRRRAER